MLTTDMKVQRIRNIRKVTRKLVKTESHITFIEKCIDRNLPSSGFKLSWTPTYETSPEEKQNVSNILDNTSLKLMQEVLNHNKMKVNILRKTKEKWWREVKEECSPRDQCSLRDIEEREMTKWTQRMLSKKQNKFSKLESNTEPIPLEQNVKENCIVNPQGFGPVQAEPIPNSKIGDNWQKVRITADGNCFFRCISISMFGTDSYYKELRHKIVNHMIAERETYTMLVDTDFDSYINNKLKTVGGAEIWATEAEITATACHLDIEIVILKEEERGVTEQSFSKFDVINMLNENNEGIDAEAYNPKKVYLYNKSDHFELLVPKQKTERVNYDNHPLNKSKQKHDEHNEWIKPKKSFKKKSYHMKSINSIKLVNLL